MTLYSDEWRLCFYMSFIESPMSVNTTWIKFNNFGFFGVWRAFWESGMIIRWELYELAGILQLLHDVWRVVMFSQVFTTVLDFWTREILPLALIRFDKIFTFLGPLKLRGVDIYSTFLLAHVLLYCVCWDSSTWMSGWRVMMSDVCMSPCQCGGTTFGCVEERLVSLEMNVKLFHWLRYLDAINTFWEKELPFFRANLKKHHRPDTILSKVLLYLRQVLPPETRWMMRFTNKCFK